MLTHLHNWKIVDWYTFSLESEFANHCSCMEKPASLVWDAKQSPVSPRNGDTAFLQPKHTPHKSFLLHHNEKTVDFPNKLKAACTNPLNNWLFSNTEEEIMLWSSSWEQSSMTGMTRTDPSLFRCNLQSLGVNINRAHCWWWNIDLASLATTYNHSQLTLQDSSSDNY